MIESDVIEDQDNPSAMCGRRRPLYTGRFARWRFRHPHVLGDEIDATRKLARDQLLDALGAVSEFPVRGHDVDAEEFRGLDHVLALRPQSRRGTLPGIAAVEDERAGPIGLQALDQRRELGETPEPAV